MKSYPGHRTSPPANPLLLPPKTFALCFALVETEMVLTMSGDDEKVKELPPEFVSPSIASSQAFPGGDENGPKQHLEGDGRWWVPLS